MSLQTFVDKGGFKLLAVARLASGSYGLVCYLLNCLAAGVEEVVSSPGELAVLLGISERQARQSLDELETCNIISLARHGGKTVAARLNLDPSTWQNLRRESAAGKRKRTPLGDAHNVRSLIPQPAPPIPSADGETGLRAVTPEGGGGNGTNSDEGRSVDGGDGLSPGEALVFPTGQREGVRGGRSGAGASDAPKRLPPEEAAVARVLESFSAQKNGAADDDKERAYASLLCENHPVEQIVALIGAFGKEIPSLGLLAGAWMHYTERFHRLDKEEISLEAYRKKIEAAERKLRSLAAAELKRAQALKVTLSADEELLLRVFMRHEHPRKQLYWALQVQSRYPHLQDFFAATASMAQRGART